MEGEGKLYLGNLYAKRDWGHAEDYVKAMWKCYQNKQKKDYVISSGKQYTVKYFIDLVCEELGIKIFGKERDLVKKLFGMTKDNIN